MLKIGIDAMGGDYAPEAAVKGAVAAARRIEPGSRIVLFGDENRIREILAAEGCPAETFDIVATSEVIEMGDHPAVAFRQKADSSITVGFSHLAAGLIDGFAGAGSTGAMMVGSMYAVKPVEGVIRPTISSLVPTAGGGQALLLDVGLNVDCKPEVLCQYGLIGSIYAQSVLGIDNPRVAVLNIGEEEAKGNAQAKATHDMMKEYAAQTGFTFVGNVEGSYIFTGKIADVIVCDGFVGNTALKLAEGLYRINKAMGGGNPFWDAMNYENIGGTPVLGVNAPVIIGHGCSTPRAIENMILSTERTIKADLAAKFRSAFKTNE
ncbi:MAG: phosphate acyltransferase [Alistipes sp.]|nr:phosphate acyltransferase [Alistipes sp.]